MCTWRRHHLAHRRVFPAGLLLLSVQGAFTLLMWKNGKLHQRRPIGTCVQIMLPVLFIGILWLVRNLTAVNKKTMCER